MPTRTHHDLTLEGALAQAAAAEERLQRSLRQGGLLVLTTAVRLGRHADAELVRRFGTSHGLTRMNCDALLLAELKLQAAAAGVDWNVVLRADAADKGSRDWTNLMRLVQRAQPALRAALLQSASPVLMVSAGLLARYELMPLIAEVEATAGRPGQTPSVWLLLPTRACPSSTAWPCQWSTTFTTRRRWPCRRHGSRTSTVRALAPDRQRRAVSTENKNPGKHNT
jgi:hypothetical protein